MEEQQQPGMATPSSEPTTVTADTNQAPPPPMKLNRKYRRAQQAFDRKMQSKASLSSKARLDDFKKLTTWKDKEESRRNRLSDEQIASVFRVALARLFKGTEIVRKREKVTFDAQLAAIVRNVKSGFKYKSDNLPAPAAEAPAPTEG